jgi:hypothetical protein
MNLYRLCLRRLLLSVYWVAFAVAACGPPAARPALAQEPQDVESARDALVNGPRFPWYDAQSDSLQRVQVQPVKDTATHRDSEWVYRERSQASTWRWDALHGVLRVLIWTLVICLIVALLVLLIYSFTRRRITRGAAGTVSEDETDQVSEQTRMENLPFPVRRPRTNLLDEAYRHYADGNYREAIIYYYSYLLVELDKSQLIHLTPGKTNRQYLYETLSLPAIAGILETTMIMFEDVFFGDRPLGRERFEQSWNRLGDFQNLVKRGNA